MLWYLGVPCWRSEFTRTAQIKNPNSLWSVRSYNIFEIPEAVFGCEACRGGVLHHVLSRLGTSFSHNLFPVDFFCWYQVIAGPCWLPLSRLWVSDSATLETIREVFSFCKILKSFFVPLEWLNFGEVFGSQTGYFCCFSPGHDPSTPMTFVSEKMTSTVILSHRSQPPAAFCHDLWPSSTIFCKHFLFFSTLAITTWSNLYKFLSCEILTWRVPLNKHIQRSPVPTARIQVISGVFFASDFKLWLCYGPGDVILGVLLAGPKHRGVVLWGETGCHKKPMGKKDSSQFISFNSNMANDTTNQTPIDSWFLMFDLFEFWILKAILIFEFDLDFWFLTFDVGLTPNAFLCVLSSTKRQSLTGAGRTRPLSGPTAATEIETAAWQLVKTGRFFSTFWGQPRCGIGLVKPSGESLLMLVVDCATLEIHGHHAGMTWWHGVKFHFEDSTFNPHTCPNRITSKRRKSYKKDKKPCDFFPSPTMMIWILFQLTTLMSTLYIHWELGFLRGATNPSQDVGFDFFHQPFWFEIRILGHL